MQKKDFAKMTIEDLKQYQDFVNSQIARAQRYLRGNVLNKEVDEKENIETEIMDYSDKEISEMSPKKVRAYYKKLLQEKEFSNWFLKNRLRK